MPVVVSIGTISVIVVIAIPITNALQHLGIIGGTHLAGHVGHVANLASHSIPVTEVHGLKGVESLF